MENTMSDQELQSAIESMIKHCEPMMKIAISTLQETNQYEELETLLSSYRKVKGYIKKLPDTPEEALENIRNLRLIFNKLKNIEERQDKLEIRQDVLEAKVDNNNKETRDELKGLKQDVRNLATQNNNLHTQVNLVQRDIQEIRFDIRLLNQKLDLINSDTRNAGAAYANTFIEKIKSAKNMPSHNYKRGCLNG